MIEALLEKVDALLVGGGMCFTFLAAQGHSTGASLLEESQVGTCERLLASAEASGKRILLPTDIVALSPGGAFGAGKEPEGEMRQVGPDVPEGWIGLDIGPGHGGRLRRRDRLGRHRVLERPHGRVRGPPLRGRDPERWPRPWPRPRAFTVVGGGDSASALKQFGLDDQVDHLSTGGGASLEFIEKGDLPGLAALRRAAAGRGPEEIMATRKPLISGNWKMNHTHLDAIAVVQKLAYTLTPRDYERADVSVHPAFTALRSVQTMLDADCIPIALGAQDVHPAESGAFTGEVSPVMLAKLNVRYVIVGPLRAPRAVRRNRCLRQPEAPGRTEARNDPYPVRRRDPRRTGGRVRPRTRWSGSSRPTSRGSHRRRPPRSSSPTSPSGPSAPAVPPAQTDAQAVCKAVRSWVAERYGSEVAGTVKVQYGGSVTPANIAELMAQADIDGALVGGASLDAESSLR